MHVSCTILDLHYNFCNVIFVLFQIAEKLVGLQHSLVSIQSNPVVVRKKVSAGDCITGGLRSLESHKIYQVPQWGLIITI